MISISRLSKAIAICLFLACGVEASDLTLRIGLCRFNDAAAIKASSASGLQVLDTSGREIASVPGGEKAVVFIKDGAICVSWKDKVQSVGAEIELVSTSADSPVELTQGTSHSYPGRIIIKADGRKLGLINLVDLEDYVLGVLPAEMPSSFNIEALKAQAVTARTYALANRGRHENQGYDLCDKYHCQVYIGAERIVPSIISAVQETSGLVMTYNGELIKPQYSSDCGGVTQQGGYPYLTSVRDCPDDGGPDFCEHNGHTWTVSWTVEELEKLLIPAYPNLRKLKSISINQKDDSGRAKEVMIDAENGGTIVTGARLRSILGEKKLMSTLFTIEIKDGKVIFNGRGFGHGVGLCQHGANGLASPPYNYTFDRILKHYFRGIEVESVKCKVSSGK